MMIDLVNGFPFWWNEKERPAGAPGSHPLYDQPFRYFMIAAA